MVCAHACHRGAHHREQGAERLEILVSNLIYIAAHVGGWLAADERHAAAKAHVVSKGVEGGYELFHVLRSLVLAACLLKDWGQLLRAADADKRGVAVSQIVCRCRRPVLQRRERGDVYYRGYAVLAARLEVAVGYAANLDSLQKLGIVAEHKHEHG